MKNVFFCRWLYSMAFYLIFSSETSLSPCKCGRSCQRLQVALYAFWHVWQVHMFCLQIFLYNVRQGHKRLKMSGAFFKWSRASHNGQVIKCWYLTPLICTFCSMWNTGLELFIIHVLYNPNIDSRIFLACYLCRAFGGICFSSSWKVVFTGGDYQLFHLSAVENASYQCS